MNAPTYCITVPVGAYHPFLRDCLNSLACQNADLQVALVDASGDPRVSEIAEEFADLLTYRHHGEPGQFSDLNILAGANINMFLIRIGLHQIYKSIGAVIDIEKFAPGCSCAPYF